MGRRLQKGNTSYLYIDDEEIGSFEAAQPQELKIPGYQNIVAIEIKNRPYAPAQDVQGTIRYLIDWKTKKIAQENTCDAFGSGLTDTIPYAYAGKRYDAKTNLIYFGKRYYDPELSRWLTRDPLGPVDHSNLYQYVFNNPFAYQDPTGEFAFAIPLLIWGAELVLPSLTAFVVPIAYTALTGVVAYAGYKVSQVIYERSYDNVLFKNSSTVRGPSNASKKNRYRTSTWKNTNPFDGPIDGEVLVGDAEGNIIPVPDGHQLGGSKDGKCIQLKDKDKKSTGLRKDGKGHPPGPKHPDDPRSWNPHAHVPGIINPDGTPWLPIR
ncbi:MAG TPA: RHS repeat-associated core domain-containing protein [Candidatus Rhabdochlamydia sp.]|nr:RHS repeat-associated core domain-containing protein [Candidatus Rhabdochlamydia sp.]